MHLFAFEHWVGRITSSDQNNRLATKLNSAVACSCLAPDLAVTAYQELDLVIVTFLELSPVMVSSQVVTYLAIRQSQAAAEPYLSAINTYLVVAEPFLVVAGPFLVAIGPYLVADRPFLVAIGPFLAAVEQIEVVSFISLFLSMLDHPLIK